MTRAPVQKAQRVFRQRQPFVMSEAVCHVVLGQLADGIRQSGAVSAVVGIAAGGRIPAEAIAVLLDVPVFHAQARHNTSDALYAQATGAVAVSLPPDFPQHLAGRIVLVDDICGTGATLTAVTDALTPRLGSGARLEWATLCRNVGSPLRPDWWAWEVDDWTVFPWEDRPDLPLRPLTVPERVLIS